MKLINLGKIVLLFVGLSLFFSSFAIQRTIILNGLETKYVDPYKITNNSSNKLFVPYTNNFDKILGNSSIDTSTTFGTTNLLSTPYTLGGFTISNSNYLWKIGPYGGCSVSCGGGTKYRSVLCEREDGNNVGDVYCGGTKPSNSTSCNTNTCYTYSWVAPPFGPCSVSCGGGTMTRTVFCKRSDGIAVGDAYCGGAATKPISSGTCNTNTCYSYSWDVGTWGSCSASCGGGTKSRGVLCKRSDGNYVSDSYCGGTKPISNTSCNTNSCVSWPFWIPYQGPPSWKDPYIGWYAFGIPGGGSGANCGKTLTKCDFPSAASRVIEYKWIYDHGFFFYTHNKFKPEGVTCITTTPLCIHQGGMVKWKLIGP